MKIKLSKIWTIFIISKISYMFIALFIYSKFTRLGDTPTYLSGGHFEPSLMFFSSTKMIGTVSYSLVFLFGQIFTNFLFLLIATYGIYYSISRLEISNKQLIMLLLLLSFPSFGIWTSIASKEAVGVFFMGIILGFIIDLIKKRPIKNYILIFLAFYLCLLFKPQYLIAIFAVLIYLYFSYKFVLNAYGKFILLIIFFIVSFTILYLFRYQINELSFIMPNHFREDASSTRENNIWIEDFDVFKNAFYGMYIAFVGPTIKEVLEKTTHLLAWIESMIIIGIFIGASLKLTLLTIKTSKINIFYLSIFIILVSWILFVHYPFGVLNPGSAIRYRENFYGFFVVLFYFLYLEIFRGYNLKIYHNREKH